MEYGSQRRRHGGAPFGWSGILLAGCGKSSPTGAPAQAQALAAIEARLAVVDRRLAERTGRLIAPEQMVRVLQDVLAAEGGLKLISLVDTGVESVRPDEIGATAAAGDELPGIFRHHIELVVEGRYFAVLDYLQHLEGLRWRFGWDRLHIETVDYPTARATLSISTLSLADAWLGV